jgi:hypothetical protein
MKNPCEDTGYEMWRQEQIDHGKWDDRAPRFSKDFTSMRYANHDPAPHLPFTEEEELFTRGDWVLYLAFCVVVIVVLVGTGVVS